MKITYAITVCNEFVQIQRLVTFLLNNKRLRDNIVILYDELNGDPEIENFLRTHSVNKEFVWHKDKFLGHFADWKNRLVSLCSGDYIFQIDADEMPTKLLIDQLPDLIKLNPDNEVYLVPRVNTVEGMSQDHMQQWGWNVNAAGWVNWPDYQYRIWKNKPEITWVNKVHETLTGFATYSMLPADTDALSLYHPKTIERQIKQNEYYNTL